MGHDSQSALDRRLAQRPAAATSVLARQRQAGPDPRGPIRQSLRADRLLRRPVGALAERLHRAGEPARPVGRRRLREPGRARDGHQSRQAGRAHQPAAYRLARRGDARLLLLLDRRRRRQGAHQPDRPAPDSAGRNHHPAAAAGSPARDRPLGHRHPARARNHAAQRHRPPRDPDARAAVPDQGRPRADGDHPADPRAPPLHRGHALVPRRQLRLALGRPEDRPLAGLREDRRGMEAVRIRRGRRPEGFGRQPALRRDLHLPPERLDRPVGLRRREGARPA